MLSVRKSINALATSKRIPNGTNANVSRGKFFLETVQVAPGKRVARPHLFRRNEFVAILRGAIREKQIAVGARLAIPGERFLVKAGPQNGRFNQERLTFSVRTPHVIAARTRCS